MGLTAGETWLLCGRTETRGALAKRKAWVYVLGVIPNPSDARRAGQGDRGAPVSFIADWGEDEGGGDEHLKRLLMGIWVLRGNYR